MKLSLQTEEKKNPRKSKSSAQNSQSTSRKGSNQDNSDAFTYELKEKLEQLEIEDWDSDHSVNVSR